MIFFYKNGLNLQNSQEESLVLSNRVDRDFQKMGQIGEYACIRDYRNNSAINRIKSKRKLYLGLLLWIRFDNPLGPGQGDEISRKN